MGAQATGKDPTRRNVSMECSDGRRLANVPECKKLAASPTCLRGSGAINVAWEFRQKVIRRPKLVGCLAPTAITASPPSFAPGAETSNVPAAPRGSLAGQYSHDEAGGSETAGRRNQHSRLFKRVLCYSSGFVDFDKSPRRATGQTQRATNA